MSNHPWAARRRALDMTQLEVASHLDVTRQYVIRLEQSLFHEAPLDIVTSLAGLYGCSVEELSLEYRAYVTETRANFRVNASSFKEVLLDYKGMAHPLVYYREVQSLSRMGFCKGLCLDYGPIADYETNKQRQLPLIVKLAAQEIYWDYTILETAVADWRKDGRADKRPGGANLFEGIRVRNR